MEVEAAMEMQRHLDQTGVHPVCIIYILEIFLVCTMFDLDRTSLHKFAPFMYVRFFGLHLVYQMFAQCNRFTQFALSKLLGLFVYTKFTQVYTVCTKFASNLNRVYVTTRFFSGKTPGYSMRKLCVDFEQTV